ncbi:MAG TPA: HNH endonuclease [Candidatus Saccharimonadales bacterium]|nr:HNH endonuclease [Candidatus Saccharimonadales bacterium]
MTLQEGISLQKGMNFRPSDKDYSIFLMSVNENAPYVDGFDSEGKILTYEGHDINRGEHKEPKKFDQPFFTKNGKLTENGRFFKAAEDYRFKRRLNPEKIRVYEKITKNVWSDKGLFLLVDADYLYVTDQKRKVFKFKLLPEDLHLKDHEVEEELELSRRIPTAIKQIVWERDQGKCVECGSRQNLHFDHILPYSKGGTSTNAENIQLLCQKHNLSKSNRIV